MIKLVLIDRDGCINELATPQMGRYVFKVEDFRVFEDVKYFFSCFLTGDRKAAIVTNQRGIALGLYGATEVLSLHTHFLSIVNQDSSNIPIFICPHDENQCDCRKPKPGLLKLAMKHFSVRAEETVFIGDQESDAMAAQSLGIRFIRLTRNITDREKVHLHKKEFQVSDLEEAWGIIQLL
jgi:D-glycero-D-manno-heptose 1,7-bisphosphate phosphatase